MTTLTPAQAQARINGEFAGHVAEAARELESLIRTAQAALASLNAGSEAWHWTAETGLQAGKAERSMAAAREMARFVQPA